MSTAVHVAQYLPYLRRFARALTGSQKIGDDQVVRLLEAILADTKPFPERLLTGERPEPIFLLTKPYRPETVRATISQALFFDERSRTAA